MWSQVLGPKLYGQHYVKQSLAIILMLQVFVGWVSSSALVEIDLLHYSSAPNECCDGSRWILIGPLKCNECDPYFKICLAQTASNDKKCLKTSRENNVNDKNLQDGNIQPNHFTMSLSTWQGALSMDVKIMDYDSLSHDDVIDHVRDIYHGVPSPHAHTVTLTGPVARLTVSVRVTCSRGYYGNDCATHCLNGTHSYCNQSGHRICTEGYSGADCSVKMTSPSTKLPSKTPRSTSRSTASVTQTSANKATHLHTSTKATQRSIPNAMSLTSTRIPSTKMTKSTAASTKLSTISIQTTKQATTTATNTRTIVTKSSPSRLKSTPPHLPQSSKPTSSIQRESQPVLLNLTTPRSKLFQTTMNSGSSTRQRVKDITTEAGSRITTSGSDIDKFTSVSPSPQPHQQSDRHKRSHITLKGHKPGIQREITEIIITAIWSQGHYENRTLLSVTKMTVAFLTETSGTEATEVSFEVVYKGRTIPQPTVDKALHSPSLTKMLASKNLSQYNDMPLTQVSPRTKSWVHGHVAVVVSVCVGAVLLIAAVLAVVYRQKRRSKSVPDDKRVIFNAEKSAVKTSVAFQESYDQPLGLENPLYDFNIQPYKSPESNA